MFSEMSPLASSRPVVCLDLLRAVRWQDFRQGSESCALKMGWIGERYIGGHYDDECCYIGPLRPLDRLFTFWPTNKDLTIAIFDHHHRHRHCHHRHRHHHRRCRRRRHHVMYGRTSIRPSVHVANNRLDVLFS